MGVAVAASRPHPVLPKTGVERKAAHAVAIPARKRDLNIKCRGLFSLPWLDRKGWLSAKTESAGEAVFI